MGFYELSKTEREQKCKEIQDNIAKDLRKSKLSATIVYFDDPDTYIRKAAYLGVGKLYNHNLVPPVMVINMLDMLIKSKSERIRQTVINAAGEIAIKHFAPVEHLFDIGIVDQHHSVKNAIQGSLKKSCEKNPAELIPFCQKYITNLDPETRRSAAHGLELRGRTQPQDIMPVLRLLQYETHKRVRPMLVHIFGQISYKKGCLEKVTAELLTWEDKALAEECFEEIIKQHHHINCHFRTVETLSPKECEEYLKKHRSNS
ncbi:MAG: hypothetical protein LBI12_05075 [Treponema sp.]|jgi:vesicle coat complex subunit|nr:hypothetical protein [Treponema sp.]